jgi:hypothetical protein
MKLGFLWVAVFCLLSLSSQAAAKRMTFLETGTGGNCNDCEFIIADGDIAIDSVDDFRAVAGKRVLLNSQGGSLEGAIALGEEFRKRGVRVTVTAAERRDGEPWYDETMKGNCLSACVYAFFGGVERDVPAESSLGIHAFADEVPDGNAITPMYTRLELTAVQRLTGVLLEYTQRMGVDPLVINWAAKQDNNGMRILTPDEMRALSVTWDAILAPPLHLELYKDGLMARTETTDTSGKVTLVCVRKELRLVFAATLPEPSPGPWVIDGLANPDNTSMLIVTKADEKDFGDWIEQTYKFTKDGNIGFATVVIDRDTLAKMVRARFIEIALGTTRSSKEDRLIRFPTDGLSQLAPLLGRNCV